MESSKITTAAQFEATYRKAHTLVDNGIILITEGKDEEAVVPLQEGLTLLDEALSTKIEKFNVGPEQLQMYAEMLIKMRTTRKEILVHFSNNMQPSTGVQGLPSNVKEDAPPSYEEYLSSMEYKDNTSDVSESAPVEYPSLDGVAKSTDELKSPNLPSQRGELVVRIDGGVQIFFIYASGQVTSPSVPSFLAIYILPEPVCSDEGSPGARGFLQVGEWTYPLVPGQSPALHSFYGAYMFPDVANPEPGTSVGILIPDTCDDDTKDLFEQILLQMTTYQEQKTPQGLDAEKQGKIVKKSASTRIAEGLVSGAEVVSKGVIWGAEKLSVWITHGSEKLKSSIPPNPEPQRVDPKWRSTATTARTVTGQAVKVSGCLVNHVGKATMCLGRKIAPTIQKHGTRAFGHLSGQSEKDSSTQVSSALEVASGAVRGASTIYLGLENAAFTLAKSLNENTVSVVTHKYGPEYGSLTDDTMYAVGQTAAVGYHVSSLGAKGIAKRAAKDTGKALLEDHSKTTDKSVPK